MPTGLCAMLLITKVEQGRKRYIFRFFETRKPSIKLKHLQTTLPYLKFVGKGNSPQTLLSQWSYSVCHVSELLKNITLFIRCEQTYFCRGFLIKVEEQICDGYFSALNKALCYCFTKNYDMGEDQKFQERRKRWCKVQRCHQCTNI